MSSCNETSLVASIVLDVVGQFLGQLSGRPLTSGEKELVSVIYDNQIDTFRVKVVGGEVWIDRGSRSSGRRAGPRQREPEAREALDRAPLGVQAPRL